MSEKLVFEQTIEGLFVRSLGPRITPALKKQLKAAGLDLDARLLPAYAFDVWMKVLELTARALYPDKPIEDAMLAVGEAFVDGFMETFLGRAVLGMTKVVGPTRTLKRATQTFRSGNNYTETKLTQIDDNTFDLWMNEVGQWPTFTAGILKGGLRAAEGLNIELRDHDGHACTYRISWKPR